jgi:hypothetical protein
MFVPRFVPSLLIRATHSHFEACLCHMPRAACVTSENRGGLLIEVRSTVREKLPFPYGTTRVTLHILEFEDPVDVLKYGTGLEKLVLA